MSVVFWSGTDRRLRVERPGQEGQEDTHPFVSLPTYASSGVLHSQIMPERRWTHPSPFKLQSGSVSGAKAANTHMAGGADVD